MTAKELFESYGITKVGDLVDLLRSLKKSKYRGKSDGSVRSFLSQTMSGVRKLPEDLKQSVVECFKSINPKLNGKKFSEELQQVFDTAFIKYKKQRESSEKLFTKIKMLDLRVATDDYLTLLEKTQTAKTITIITAEPAEIKNNTAANKLKEELLKKVGLINTGDLKANYSFYLAKGGDSYSTPIDFWESLYKYAKTLNIQDLNSKLLEINEGTSPSLKVFVLPDDEIDVTHGILNEGTLSQIGFVTIYNKIPFEDIEEMSVSRMEGKTLERVLTRLNKFKLQSPEEFTFSKALEILSN